MTEEMQNAEVATSEPSAPAAPSSTPAPDTQVAAPAEKMVPQSVVDKVVGTRVKEAYEKARRETLADIEKQRQANVASPQTPQGMGGMPQASPDQIRQMIQEEAWKMSNLAQAERIANDFTQKIDAAKQKYADFQDKYNALNLEKHPQLVMWTNSLDNTGDVIYDIASNPAKVAQIMMLANGGFPELAQQELTKLSDSIKANQKAQEIPKANAPLSQIKPSSVGGDDGSSNVSAARQQPWLYA